MSAKARSMAADGRVPSLPSSGTVMVRSSKSGRSRAGGLDAGAGGFGDAGAVADRHRGGLVDRRAGRYRAGSRGFPRRGAGR
jgi:hypothetical protein